MRLVQMKGRENNMPDIKHMIAIEVEPHIVFPLVATADGFKKWWASDVTEDKSNGNVELGFFKRATVYGLKPVELIAPRSAHWLCQSGKEWSGTRMLFDLAPSGANTVLRFTHADWASETDYFVSCTTAWGELMFRIKATAEGKTPGPLFAPEGLAY